MSTPDETLPGRSRVHDNGSEPERFSALDQLAQTRDADLATRTMEVPIRLWGRNGWKLVVRLRALSYVKAMPIARRAIGPMFGMSDDPEAELKAACDTLVAACDDIYAVDPKGEHVPLLKDGEPCRFDARTCEALALREPTSARDAVVLIFKNEWHVTEAWGDYQSWLTEGNAEVNEAVLGEA